MQIITRKEAISKGLKYYFLNKSCPRGHFDQHRVSGGCNTCRKLKERGYKRKQKEKNPLIFIFQDAKRRSKRLRLDFNIVKEDFVLFKKCPLLGIPIKYNGFIKRTDNSASLDRIDSSKGYIKDNTWIISDRANRIKRDATFEEFERIYLGWKKKINPAA